tara:strand:+ start:1080 stop:1316 length:237 start_codon:yes stop_codon:yes gene_type:complete
MEHLVKLLRDSYDLQEEKSEETAYWHLQKLRSEIKQLTLTDVSNNEVALKAFVEEYVEAFEDGQGCDTALYRQAKSLL